MKLFLKYIAIFFLPLLILISAGEYFARQSDNVYRYKHAFMSKNAGSVDILILGSSHTFYGIQPHILSPKAFSLAIASQDTRYDLFLLENYKKDYRNLKTVIMPVSYFTFFDAPTSEVSPFRASFYKMYMDCPFPRGLKYDFEFMNMPVFREKIKKYFSRNKRKEYDLQGWGTMHSLPDKDSLRWDNEKVFEALKFHTAKNSSHVEENYNNIEKILKFCKQRGIEAVLITTPCYKTYNENINPAQMQKTYALIDKLCRKHNIRYYDYRLDSRFSEEDFYDGDHLSDKGAEKFSIILKKDIFSCK